MAKLDYANNCLKDLKQMESSSKQRTFAFKQFLSNFKLLISEVEKCMEENDPKSFNSIMILCLSQVKKVLPMLQNVIQENGHGVKEKVWYLCERLQWCICELRRVLEEGKNVDEDIAGSFVHHIDYALQILSKHDSLSSNCRWKPLIDNILCQALTTAKISNEIDFKEITVTCKKVLEESNELLTSETTVSKHTAESLSGNLVTLEQRVNTAVLRLVLQVFTDSNKPIRNLVSVCGKGENTERSLSSLEPLINEYDNHSDRIFHIGTFAMACSEDFQRIQGIKCCLASLESLDNYLIPALTAFYLDNQQPAKRAFIKFLTSHWQQEIMVIQTLLDGIIDTTAFCQICLEDISEKVEKMKKVCLAGNSLDGELLNSLVKVGQKLYNHLEYNKVTLNIDSQLIHDISLALNECDAVNKIYLSPNENIGVKSILKRYELLMNNIQKMSKHFSQVDNFPGTITLSSSVRIKNKYLNQLKKCESVKQNAECTYEMDELIPYLSHATERNNTFYVRTPCKMKHSIPIPDAGVQESISPASEQSNEIDISDILDNLTSLSDTLSSVRTVCNNTSTKYKNDECNNESNITHQDSSSTKYNLTKYKILSSCINQMSSASVRTGEVSDINTPDRLQDLKVVEAKIEMLKLGNV